MGGGGEGVKYQHWNFILKRGGSKQRVKKGKIIPLSAFLHLKTLLDETERDENGSAQGQQNPKKCCVVSEW